MDEIEIQLEQQVNQKNRYTTVFSLIIGLRQINFRAFSGHYKG
ncbi:MAG: hypothetical protein SVY10_16430 [Thermodesulfobacteriota bacterium]|nr:hypothetical protein [Thermodesulfobacteriota bacterium]